jgi:hypothetical protein
MAIVTEASTVILDVSMEVSENTENRSRHADGLTVEHLANIQGSGFNLQHHKLNNKKTKN